METQEQTQPTQNTHGHLDPRRMGRNNSGLSEEDISDVLCILHPCSPAAFRIVATTAKYGPQNVLQNDGFGGRAGSDAEEAETFILSQNAPNQPMDLALRFSTQLKNPVLGFVFGRNPGLCDVVLGADTFKRISNAHFAVSLNDSGVLMLRDMSTNGTIVDEALLRGKAQGYPDRRMLNPGSVIQILSPKKEDTVKFIVRIPSREDHIHEYEQKVQTYMQRRTAAEAAARGQNFTGPTPDAQAHVITRHGPSTVVHNPFGMHWSGGVTYNVVGQIGKGAFATVFQLATKAEGDLYAAKELEKRKFMKNGIVDRKLHNEMQIMKAVNHHNIVQYIDYVEHLDHMYIIMEFVSCGDLSRYLSQDPIREDLGRTMAAQVFDALTYLHQKKITHRDIKPDNILIANADPANFLVKLSDFGLSKVVQEDETFLKTFCGTLLYCAPEVFPQYNGQAGSKGTKRARGKGVAQRKVYHSYSQSVDIWSFGAVLWYALCLSPPFEGVADATGYGMFTKIMNTPLDTSDLLRCNVSEKAIILLMLMLNTDPAARPSPADCLRHAWFADLTGNPEHTTMGSPEQELGAIEEEDDPAEEPDLSQLSLGEQEVSHGSQESEISIHSGSIDFFDPRKSKRVKPNNADSYRVQDELVGSSPEIFALSMPTANPDEGYRTQTRPNSRPMKLFGEISQSDFVNPPGLPMDIHGRLDDWEPDEQRGCFDDWEQVEHREDTDHGEENLDDSHLLDAQRSGPSPSLMGTESLVRELKMDSPHSSKKSADADLSEPTTPNTPSAPQARSAVHPNSASSHEEATPKQIQEAVFSRQINLPIPPSFYYDPFDPSTHTLEYASKVSGHDYVHDPMYMNAPASSSIPATRAPSSAMSANESALSKRSQAASNVLPSSSDKHGLSKGPRNANNENERPASGSRSAALATVNGRPEFVKPSPRLGQLIPTEDSFSSTTLNLTDRLSIWGRHSHNTHIYPDVKDTRIPKRGILIICYASGLDQYAYHDHSWMKLPDLHCVVATESSAGIRVNGVRLDKTVQGRRACGRIHSGDELTIVDGKDGVLKYVCKFFHGESKEPRASTAPRFEIMTDDTPLREDPKGQSKAGRPRG